MKTFKQGSDIRQLHFEKKITSATWVNGRKWGERENEKTTKETHAEVLVKDDDGLQQRRRQSR